MYRAKLVEKIQDKMMRAQSIKEARREVNRAYEGQMRSMTIYRDEGDVSRMMRRDYAHNNSSLF